MIKECYELYYMCEGQRKSVLLPMEHLTICELVKCRNTMNDQHITDYIDKVILSRLGMDEENKEKEPVKKYYKKRNRRRR